MASEGPKSIGTRERQPKFPSAKTLLDTAHSQQQQLLSGSRENKLRGRLTLLMARHSRSCPGTGANPHLPAVLLVERQPPVCKPQERLVKRHQVGELTRRNCL